MRPNNLFLSIPQAARLLGKGPAAVRRAVQRGDLAAVKVPGCQARVPATAIAELLEAAHQPALLREPKNSDKTSVRLAEPVGA
jgi:excisionase family DNA binding protein